MTEHPLLDTIRELAEPLETEAKELLERYEKVSLELSALRDAERALIAGLVREVKREREGVGSGGELKPGGGDGSSPPSEPGPAPPDPPRKPPLADQKQTRTERALELREQRREVVFGIIEKAGGWIKPPAILEASGVPRQAYQLAIRDLTEAGRIESQGSRGSLAFRVAGAAQEPEDAPPDPPEGRASPEPPEAPSEPESAPEPAPSPAGTEATVGERGDRTERPRSPARAARRARRRKPAPPIRPLPGAEQRRNGSASRSDGIEKPPAPPKRSEPFRFAEGDRAILDCLAERPLTPEGLAIKLRRPLVQIGPRLQALVNAGYLSRGEQGNGNGVFGRTPRPLPA